MSMMKAAAFRGQGRLLNIERREVPAPGPGQLLLRVVHCGICGTDLRSTAVGSATQLQDGAVLGHEFCGDVAVVGHGVTGWKEGDRAVSLPYVGCGACETCIQGEPIWCREMKAHTYGELSGAFAEYVVVGARGSVRLPDSLSWRRAALVEPVAVGLHAAGRAGLKPNDDVLVIGAGAIGLAVAMCARALGARHVVVAARSLTRAELAKKLGATDVVELGDGTGSMFDRHPSGRTPIVVECVGAEGMVARTIDFVPPRATLVLLGAHGAQETFLPIAAMRKELNLIFSRGYNVGDFRRAVEMLASGVLDPEPMISGEVGFSAFPAALEELRHRRDLCKVLLTPRLQ